MKTLYAVAGVYAPYVWGSYTLVVTVLMAYMFHNRIQHRRVVVALHQQQQGEQ